MEMKVGKKYSFILNDGTVRTAIVEKLEPEGMVHIKDILGHERMFSKGFVKSAESITEDEWLFLQQKEQRKVRNNGMF